METTTKNATHRVELNGMTRHCTIENFQEVCDELVKAAGGGVPKIVELAKEAEAVKPATAPVAKPAPVVVAAPAPVADPKVSKLINTARSVADFEAAKAAGFAPKATLFERGTAVNSTGVENARRSRLEHDRKPTVRDYCADFVAQIESEARQDTLAFPVADIRMSEFGRVITPDGARYTLERRALQGLITRLGCGGASYLIEHCPPKLRAVNVNQQAKMFAELEELAHDEAVQAAVLAGKPMPELDRALAVLRTRIGSSGEREGFALVSDSYTSFDVDQIARALALAAPEDARGTVSYDGTRARFEIVFHSDVQPADYVCGEFFKSAVLIDANDTGNGGIRGNAAAYQNLCLNLIVIDEAAQPVFNLRHVGSVEELARKFREGFDRALGKLEHFLRAWGYAVHEDVRARSQAATVNEIPIPIEEALPGFYNAMIERELVPVRVGTAANRKAVIGDLVEMYRRDDSAATRDGFVTRAGIINSITRFAHEKNEDPWYAGELERAAGALVWGRKGREPEPLPYEPME